MKLGMVGLGRMGANIALRLIEAGHGIIAFDRLPAKTPVLSTAINERFASRGANDFADRLLSAMRFQFGGHLEKHS